MDSLAEEVFRAKQAQDKLDQQVAKRTDEKADPAKATEARSVDVKTTPATKVHTRLYLLPALRAQRSACHGLDS